jgi:hypothetical protein
LLGIVVFALSSSFSLSEVEALFNCLSLKSFEVIDSLKMVKAVVVG